MKYRRGDEPVKGYRLVRVLGRGGFGIVWLAEGPGGVPVALKIIDLTIGRGRKELRAIHRVKSIVHPNLVPIQGLWLVDHYGRVLDEGERESVETALKTIVIDKAVDTVVADQPTKEDDGPDELIIAMGLCEESLADRLSECRRNGKPGIPAAELLGYIEDAARAIDYLNSKSHDLGEGNVGGIQHGDIKPGNLMIVGGAAQVCDFGLARVLRDSNKTTIAYTPAYAAPETITLNRPSATTDQYSLAVTYLELRCGSLPFNSESHYMIAKAHTEGQVDLSALPPAEKTVIAKAMSVDPSDRYASASEMARQLRRAAPETELPVTALTGTNAGSDDVLTEIVTEVDASSSEADQSMPTTVIADRSKTEEADDPNSPQLSLGRRVLVGLLSVLVGAAIVGWFVYPQPERMTAKEVDEYDGTHKFDQRRFFSTLSDIDRLFDESDVSPSAVLKELEIFESLRANMFTDLQPKHEKELAKIQAFMASLKKLDSSIQAAPEPDDETKGEEVIRKTHELIHSHPDDFDTYLKDERSGDGVAQKPLDLSLRNLWATM